MQPGGIFLFTFHIGEETIHVDEFLGKKVAIDLMLFTTDFIFSLLTDSGFEKIEMIEREPYPGWSTKAGGIRVCDKAVVPRVP